MIKDLLNKVSNIKNQTITIFIVVLLLILVLLLVFITRNSTNVLNSIKSNLTYSFDTKSSVQSLDEILGRVKSNSTIFADTVKNNFSYKFMHNSQALDNYLSSFDALAANMVLNTKYAQGIWFQIDDKLARYKGDYSFCLWWHYRNGKLVKHEKNYRILSLKDDPYYFDALKAKKPIWTDVYIDPDIKVPMITYSVPIYKDGKFIGCAGMDLSLEGINNILKTIHSEYKGSELYLLNENYEITASFPHNDKILNKNFFEYKKTLLPLKEKIKFSNKSLKSFDYKGRYTEKIAIFSHLSSNNYFVVTVPTSTLYKKFNILINLSYVMFVILAFLAFYALSGKFKLIVTNDKLKRQTIVLKELKEIAEEATRVRSDFLANMSHEIRTPMNGIMGYMQILRETELSEEQKDFVDEALKSSESLLCLINDVLDFSKIESGKMVLENISFDLHSLLEDVANLAASNAHKKGIEVNALIYSDIPQRVLGDPSRLKQVFNNLVGNAVKFTEKGEVLLSAKKVSEDNNIVEILFEVTDTGIGIPEKAQKTLFEAFIQADSSATRKYGGTGLGLAIVKNIVEMMKGDIKLESEVGKGSKFSFILKFEKDFSSGISLQASPEYLKNTRILIVDDNETNLKIMRHYLESAKCIVHEANSADNAINMLENTENIDLMIIDYCMPDKNGYELASVIKSNKKLQGIPLIMYTSVARRGDCASLKEKGFIGYLTKPVRKDNLLKGISLALKSKGVVIPDKNDVLITRHTIKENSFNSKSKILLVEDYPDNQKIISIILNKGGYSCDIASNGIEAVEAYKNKQYDLILMDCQMPEMDGYEATKQIRILEHDGCHIPIIALTAHSMNSESVEKCKNAGMDDYISKPIDIEKTMGKLKEYLNEKEETENETDIISEIMKNLYFTKEEALELFNEYMEILPESIQELKDACEKRDFEVVKRIAHTLKGSSVRIEKLTELFLSLEKAGESCNIELCNSIVKEVENYLVGLKING